MNIMVMVVIAFAIIVFLSTLRLLYSTKSDCSVVINSAENIASLKYKQGKIDFEFYVLDKQIDEFIEEINTIESGLQLLLQEEQSE